MSPFRAVGVDHRRVCQTVISVCVCVSSFRCVGILYIMYVRTLLECTVCPSLRLHMRPVLSSVCVRACVWWWGLQTQLCTCIGVEDKSHMRPLRHKGGNICIEGPLCPSLMEIQSSSLSPCSLVMPAAKPQMDHYVPAEWEGQETSDGNWNGGGETLIQLRSSDTNSNRMCSFHEVHTYTDLEDAYIHVKGLNMHTYKQGGHTCTIRDMYA